MFALNLIKLITMKKLLLSLAIALVGFSSFAQISLPIVYVNQAATGANNGASWTNAYTSLRTALLNTPANRQIWIASGTYKPYVNSRTDYFAISVSGLNIYGGFAGNETSLNQRVFGSNETILSGDVNGDDAGTVDYSNASYNDNSYSVIGINTNAIILDRLTIKGGKADGSTTPNESGAAIRIQNSISQLTLQNCRIIKNISRNGGAVFAQFTSNSTLGVNACEFSENVGGFGASIYTDMSSSNTLSLNVSNCLFANNKALNTFGTNGYAGSSIWAAAYGTAATISSKIINCTFANNSDAGTISGMNNTNRSTVVLSRASGSGFFTAHTASISNCVFWGNTNPAGVAPCISKGNDIAFVTTLTLLHCSDESNFIGLTTSVGSTGNNNSNPLFVNAAAGNFRLAAGSPAINTGTNTPVVGSADLDNNQRIFNTTVDRGAFEFGSIPSSINELNTINEVLLYPNPSSSMLNIKTEDAIENISIYNTLGALVLETNETTFSVEKLNSGVYIIQVKTEKGTGVSRFIKE
jgi:hypothetical protein